ncbi:MAG: RHH-type transcriptional regulator, proline utilization regulon repressor / proline dehydrogenase [Actinomycetota bacterium]|jgi:RHH-type proline utilization regulon transcriptional repressor/proline dehydrogenase/delta 1-pyrroline-5-carboxylate dehydrogenase
MTHDAALVDEAVALAAELLEAASALETRQERRHRRRLARMLADPASRRFSLDLADEVLRIHAPSRAAQRLRALVDDGVPRFLGGLDRAMLRVGAVASTVAPRLVMPLVDARVRRETGEVLLPADEPALAEHIARREAEHAHLNLNLLGEAILGEDDARRRVADVVELLERPHVDYVSVKISSICSQIDALAFDQSVDRIAKRLRILYRAAQAQSPPKFVNLDMEEYRDLHLTIAAFTKVLDEDEFASLDAGIVLQAYLPDSYWALIDLCDWASGRFERAGGRIKIRIVKGANLAMETVDAELHGWAAAPFDNKADVDANYKRMLDVVLDDKHASAVRVGVASHNLFDVAWALTLRRHCHAEDRVEIEMLEGMAPPQSRATAAAAGSVLLYGPATKENDIESAVAYLARRLDENAAPENFLHALFSMQPGSASFKTEEERFRRAVDERRLPPGRPRRHHDRRASHEHHADAAFFNEPDTDFTNAVNRRWVTDELANWHQPCRPAPARPTVEDVDAAVARASAAADGWRSLPSAERAAILQRVAREMSAARGSTIAAMAHTAAKTVAEGDTEVSEAVDFARYYAQSIDTVDELRDAGATFDPHRVTVVASPWNFPYAIPAGGVLAALAAGSAVILKPAPETRPIGRLVVDHCRRGGVPADVVQLLTCDDDDAGRRLITHDDVDAVVLTGSWETARLFRSWKPQLALHAETSGKNAIVVTSAADYDAAVRDIVRSAFGHAGQKCSAASLLILEAPVYDDPRFIERLADAVRSLRVGEAPDIDSTVGPLVQTASGALLRAFRTLDAGEEWLVEPKQLDDCLWTPGVKLGVAKGSWFHTAECFGPVLGVMRADSLEHAITLQNGTPFGLTAGLQSLDPDEIALWEDRVEAGNLYVNRAITGAVVRRQPFGGWKRSAMGPGAKAGGPNYVMSMGAWTGVDQQHDYEAAWGAHFAVSHDPSALAAESNVFRYVPYHRPVLVRTAPDTRAEDIERCRDAARISGATLIVSRDSDDDLAKRLDAMKPAKVRALGPVSDALFARCDELGIPLDTAPVTAVGRLELLHWVREQSVTETLHRYGNVRAPKRAPEGDALASSR